MENEMTTYSFEIAECTKRVLIGTIVDVAGKSYKHAVERLQDLMFRSGFTEIDLNNVTKEIRVR